MKIGIIGAGQIGGAFARRLVDLGHRVVLANSRGPHTLAGVVAGLGARASAGTVEQAARSADVVVVAVPFGRIRELPPAPFAGRVVIDPNNYDPDRDGPEPRIAGGETTSGQVLAAHLADALVVKAFNTVWYRRILEEGRADRPLAERIGVPIAADDPFAKRIVSDLAERMGFAPVDNGTLADSRRQELGTPVFNTTAGPDEVAALLLSA